MICSFIYTLSLRKSFHFFIPPIRGFETLSIAKEAKRNLKLEYILT